MSPPSHLQSSVCERLVLLQLQRVPLHVLHSAVQLQLTTSSSAWGATGVVETAGVQLQVGISRWKFLQWRRFLMATVEVSTNLGDNSHSRCPVHQEKEDVGIIIEDSNGMGACCHRFQHVAA